MRAYRLSSSRLLALAPLLCLLAMPGTPAKAENKSSFSGQFGFVFVGRNNLGELGQQYRSGVLFGVHAGVDLAFEDSDWSVGLDLATLVRGYYFASSFTAVDQTVDITEMSLGLRLRRRLPGENHHIFASFGSGFTASNVPLPPNFGRRQVGLYEGLGYSRRLVGEWSWALETRYAHYFDGPEHLSLFGTITAGFGN